MRLNVPRDSKAFRDVRRFCGNIRRCDSARSRFYVKNGYSLVRTVNRRVCWTLSSKLSEGSCRFFRFISSSMTRTFSRFFLRFCFRPPGNTYVSGQYRVITRFGLFSTRNRHLHGGTFPSFAPWRYFPRSFRLISLLFRFVTRSYNRICIRYSAYCMVTNDTMVLSFSKNVMENERLENILFMTNESPRVYTIRKLVNELPVTRFIGETIDRFAVYRAYRGIFEYPIRVRYDWSRRKLRNVRVTSRLLLNSTRVVNDSLGGCTST